jgi:hypothetical protein
MTARILPLPIKIELRCSSCGAAGSGSCHCGTGYVPAGEYAAKMARENPEMSNRAIAEMTGVSYETVRKARDNNLSPETRIGRDGKVYPVKPKREPLRIAGGDDFKYAKSMLNQVLMAFKRDMSEEDWEATLAWLERWLERKKN